MAYDSVEEIEEGTQSYYRQVIEALWKVAKNVLESEKTVQSNNGEEEK